jgi:hypothetical protein
VSTRILITGDCAGLRVALASLFVQHDCILVEAQEVKPITPHDFTIQLAEPPECNMVINHTKSYYPPIKGKRGKVRRW